MEASAQTISGAAGCPFCGQKPQTYAGSPVYCALIACLNERCMVKPKVDFGNAEEVLRTWNHRPGQTGPALEFDPIEFPQFEGAEPLAGVSNCPFCGHPPVAFCAKPPQEAVVACMNGACRVHPITGAETNAELLRIWNARAV